MDITYTDQEIAALIQERKVLPVNWLNTLLKANNKNRELIVTGDNENKFHIIARRKDIQPLDFSVISTVVVPLSNRQFRLRRYNGWTSPHYNSIEKEEIDGFHIHYATERYQQRGLAEDAYAQATNRYNNFDSAFQCLIEDANFEELPKAQLTLFEEV